MVLDTNFRNSLNNLNSHFKAVCDLPVFKQRMGAIRQCKKQMMPASLAVSSAKPEKVEKAKKGKWYYFTHNSLKIKWLSTTPSSKTSKISTLATHPKTNLRIKSKMTLLSQTMQIIQNSALILICWVCSTNLGQSLKVWMHWSVLISFCKDLHLKHKSCSRGAEMLSMPGSQS